MADYSLDLVVLSLDEDFHSILPVRISCAIKEWRSVNRMPLSHKAFSSKGSLKIGGPHCLRTRSDTKCKVLEEVKANLKGGVELIGPNMWN